MHMNLNLDIQQTLANLLTANINGFVDLFVEIDKRTMMNLLVENPPSLGR